MTSPDKGESPLAIVFEYIQVSDAFERYVREMQDRAEAEMMKGLTALGIPARMMSANGGSYAAARTQQEEFRRFLIGDHST